MSHDSFVTIAGCAGLGRPRELARALASLDLAPDVIIETLGRHTLIRLVLIALPEPVVRAELSPQLADMLERWRARSWLPIEDYVRAFEQASHALKTNDVQSLLLKGFYFGVRLYGGITRRPQHDVDMLVQDRDFRRACRALTRAGFVDSSDDLHSRTYRLGEVKLDLHRCFRRAPAFRVDERVAWDSAIEVRLGSLTVRTLSDEWTLVFLLLSAFEDIGQGTVKLKQLTDIFLWLRAVDAETQWDDFFSRREREALLGVSVNVLALVVTLFESAADCPRLAAALTNRSHLIADPRRDTALALVFAPAKDVRNLAWFAKVYPGSLALYLARFWYGGFPDNLARFNWRRLRRSLQLAAGPSRPDTR